MTYENPVYHDYFADPFVLKRGDMYYAYGTAPFPQRTFPALRSSNLVDWEPLGDVLEPLPDADLWYWAPEVAYRDGGFHMYYSAGAEEGEGQRLRRAVADRPEGPFRDSGEFVDPDEPFSIDAHPFCDDDGSWYLFYCIDFLEGDRVGTGIVVDRLDEVGRVAGRKQTVVRPFADWNLFAAERTWYDRTWDWYTVEGPFVLKRDGLYYCFFSGGAWREPNYGVSYAIAGHPLDTWVVPEVERPTVLQTVPERVLGPGHASIVRSPSGHDDWIVYHAWPPDRDARLMRIDRLEWTPDGPRCDGPSTDLRPAPA